MSFSNKDPFDKAVFGSIAVFGGVLVLLAAIAAVRPDEAPQNAAAEAPAVEETAEAPMETMTEEAPAEETAEAPVEEAPVEETAETPAEEAPAEETAEAPAEEAPAEEAAEAPAEEAPAEETAEAPAEEAPAEETAEAPAEEAPTEEAAEAVEPEATGEAAETETAAAESASSGEWSAEQMALLDGDAEAGQRVWNQCRACHVADQEQNRVGPHLVGIIGRDIASIDGFRYSQALQDLQGQQWTPAELDAWLENPSEYAPGTSMSYRGIRDEGQRRDLLAYLNSLQN